MKNIRKGWEKFSCHTRFEVGDGSKIIWYCSQRMPLLQLTQIFMVAQCSGI
jgi:hypothetical protein